MFTRRGFLAAGPVLFAVPLTAIAQQCRVTPRDALGPFYKSGAPSQTELSASNRGGSERLVVTGRVSGMPNCRPLPGALVEAWHADARGEYTLFLPGKKDDERCLLREHPDRRGRALRVQYHPAGRVSGASPPSPRANRRSRSARSNTVNSDW